ncbi:MAG: hypothetical protein ACREXW_05030 [Gammaproteobacteria bacterium]
MSLLPAGGVIDLIHTQHHFFEGRQPRQQTRQVQVYLPSLQSIDKVVVMQLDFIGTGFGVADMGASRAFPQVVRQRVLTPERANTEMIASETKASKPASPGNCLE